MNAPPAQATASAAFPTPADADFDRAQHTLATLQSLLARIVVGQDELVAQLVTAVFAGGHVLIEGLPGLGKTHLVKALAGALGLRWARVQCTPDLMPADVTGAEILLSAPGGASGFEFRRGPVFAELVLVDEVNRATPRTQAALLEAMQERQVTHAGVAHPLPSPFTVIATQNPIELEGTYPLPEAQMDRFLMHVSITYPPVEDEVDVIRLVRGEEIEANAAPADKPVRETAAPIPNHQTYQRASRAPKRSPSQPPA